MLQLDDHNPFLPPLIRALFTVAGLTPHQGYQWVPATYFHEKYHPTVEVELPLLITDLAAQDPAQLQALLQNAYPAAHPLTLMEMITEGAPMVIQTTVAELALRLAATPASILAALLLCVPPLPAGSSFSALQATVAHLRSPVGCPWDRAQTLQSMRHDLLGECAEVLEAVDLDSTEENGPHIAEELGDLLMAAVLMVQIATDGDRFQMAQVMHLVVSKLIRRHPHVFGDVTVDGVDTVLVNWDAIKAQEKAAKGQSRVDPLDGVPASLPALEKARALQSKAAKAGLLDRVALVQADPRLAPWQDARWSEAQLGELLWRLVALAHLQELNAEDALRNYSTHFRQNPHSPM